STRRDAATTVVINGDNGRPAVLRLEEHELCLEVRLLGAMKVQMVNAQLSEASYVETAPVDPSHGKCVARHLDSDGGDTPFSHDSQHRVQLSGLWRRPRRCKGSSVDDRPNRADHT